MASRPGEREKAWLPGALLTGSLLCWLDGAMGPVLQSGCLPAQSSPHKVQLVYVVWQQICLDVILAFKI